MPCQVEQVERVGIEGFIGQGERQDVKVSQRVFALQRVERQAGGAQLCFHIRPGSVGAFCPDFRALVEQLIEDCQTQV